MSEIRNKLELENEALRTLVAKLKSKLWDRSSLAQRLGDMLEEAGLTPRFTFPSPPVETESRLSRAKALMKEWPEWKRRAAASMLIDLKDEPVP